MQTHTKIILKRSTEVFTSPTGPSLLVTIRVAKVPKATPNRLEPMTSQRGFLFRKITFALQLFEKLLVERFRKIEQSLFELLHFRPSLQSALFAEPMFF